MASSCKAIALLLIFFLLLAPPLQARELLDLRREEKVGSLTADGSSSPPSSPSEKEASRMLGSVPSPGVGH
ncbi:hypothetical protein MUK42_14020 [Musa troglodytarum]|uniref:Uncharacterized protein n=1 Tax=Musa troglodytarum TaxID=320322 RepID=A0A9E7GJ59_9LILI|nr:hypothetical protein MUK42_14020 [Musa troglodytarum]